ncbi:MAG: B12-binding domain-containing protein, partial [Bacilli bacterium]
MYEEIMLDREKIITKAFSLIDPDHETRTENYIVKSRRDLRYSIDFTLEAIIVKEKSILINYYKWLIETLAKYNISKEPLIKMFEVLKELLQEYLKEEDRIFLNNINSEEIATHVVNQEDPMPLNDHAETYLSLLLAKDRHKANQFIQDLLKGNVSIDDIYIKIIQSAMVKVGYLWQHRKINVADEHMATIITQYVMMGLYPYIFDTKKHGKKLVALSLGDELHEIGIRMVADLFEYHGFFTSYLGANMPIESILEHLRKNKPHLLAISVTLGNHLSQLITLIDRVRS